MPITLTCKDLKMRYPGQQAWALGDESEGVSFEVAQGELFALLGPSGCGKTTTLRIVGGFVRASAGQVLIEDRDVTAAPPYARPTNTVFQSYALFPHKSVADNVAFGLKVKRVPRAERRQRVEAALAMVGLSEHANRRVGELSGGQAQRAALARALVNRPAVLLLDEPLGALDLKLRRQMQDEIARLKLETKTSFVHVTHDQEEACAIADRIAVMDAGKIVQVATPVELYKRPKNTYVAEFINAGTIVRGEARRNHDTFEVSQASVIVRGPAEPMLNGSAVFAAVLPPHRVQLRHMASEVSGGAGGDVDQVVGTVERVTFTGTVFDCYIRVSDALLLRASLTLGDAAAIGGVPEHGAQVLASWRPEDVLFVEAQGRQEAEAEQPLGGLTQ
jgi:spermidine/putrescine transport system ATP-binding protein